MRITGTETVGLPPTNPFHIARAYGVRGGGAAAGVEVSPLRGPQGTQASPEAGRPVGITRLVAGVVPGGVKFDDAAVPAMSPPAAGVVGAATYSMHPRPADRDAAATGVWVGRAIDVNG